MIMKNFRLEFSMLLLSSLFFTGLFLSGCAQHYVAQGNRSFAFKYYNESAGRYESALTEDSSDKTALLMAGWSYFKMAEYARALERFKKLSELDPKSDDALEGIGWTYFKLGQYNDSIQTFQTLHKRDKDRAAALEGIAYSYFKLGDVVNASHYLKLAILENPRSSDNHLIRGYVAMMETNYPLAICSFKNAQSLLAKRNPDVDVALGNAYLATKDYQHANNSFDQALKKNSQHAGALAGKKQISK